MFSKVSTFQAQSPRRRCVADQAAGPPLSISCVSTRDHPMNPKQAAPRAGARYGFPMLATRRLFAADISNAPSFDPCNATFLGLLHGRPLRIFRGISPVRSSTFGCFQAPSQVALLDLRNQRRQSITTEPSISCPWMRPRRLLEPCPFVARIGPAAPGF